ncbi:MAG: modified peptide precursor CbpA [Verrucomicrobia bacterium]|nr:modified peptide precursor CbpA [Verrucomicrobiota bacterium]
MKKKTQKAKKDIIAQRKTCKAKGIGLSHYVMMEAKKK